MVSVPFGVRVMVLLTTLPIFHVPRTAPARVICTQLPVKKVGMLRLESVTRVLPLGPLRARPLPSDGSTAASPLVPLLSTVRAPYCAPGPLTQIVPAPPQRLLPELPVAFCVAGTMLVGSVYSMAIAPPPPEPYAVASALPASILPAPEIFPAVIQIDPPAADLSEPVLRSEE